MKNINVRSFKNVDLSEFRIAMIVIYNSPQDYPGKYIARVWDAAVGKPTNCIQERDNLEDLREDINAAGFKYKFPRAAGDDPVIIESWMR